MIPLIREFLKTGKISLSHKGLTAEGGLGIIVVFVIAMIIVFRIGR